MTPYEAILSTNHSVQLESMTTQNVQDIGFFTMAGTYRKHTETILTANPNQLQVINNIVVLKIWEIT